MNEVIRAFIAIELSEGTRAEACAAAQALQSSLKAANADVKWVAADNIHLTLRFLGNIDRHMLSSVETVLADIAAKCRPFTICLKGLGAFPDPSSPKVIWAGVSDGAAEAVHLSACIESSLVKLGVPTESRVFSPHITLGRVRSEKNIDKLRKAIESSTFEAASKTQVGHITLFKSQLAPGGSIYTSLLKARLSRPGL
jgi:2'-5' RNA ligase